jgi:hypothetical protein
LLHCLDRSFQQGFDARTFYSSPAMDENDQRHLADITFADEAIKRRCEFNRTVQGARRMTGFPLGFGIQQLKTEQRYRISC